MHSELSEQSKLDLEMRFKQFSDCTSISFKHPPIQYLEDNKNVFDFEFSIALLVLRDFQRELLRIRYIYSRRFIIRRSL